MYITDNDIWPADVSLENQNGLTKSYWTPKGHVRVICIYI